MVRAQWIYRCDIVHKRDKDSSKQTEAATLRVTIRGKHNTGCADLQDDDNFMDRRQKIIIGACSKGRQADSS